MKKNKEKYRDWDWLDICVASAVLMFIYVVIFAASSQVIECVKNEAATVISSVQGEAHATREKRYGTAIIVSMNKD